MNRLPHVEMLAQLGARFAVLVLPGYAVPVPFRIRAPAVECRVPAWCSPGEEPGEVTLVAVDEKGALLRWLLIRGIARAVPAPDWEELAPPVSRQLSPEDLYHILRITPRRIEWIDESCGWGVRETVDL